MEHLYESQKYKDVTDEFFRLTKEIKAGDLAHTSDFVLFQSVRALEIGNDKMDSGLMYIPLEDEKMPELSTAQHVAMMVDLLLAREMSWHSGRSLVQTILACLPLEKFLTPLVPLPGADLVSQLNSQLRVDSWESVAKVVFLSVVKSVDLAEQYAASSLCLFAEEDLIVGNYGLTLPNLPTSTVYRLLDAAIAFAEREGASELVKRLKFRNLWVKLLESYVVDKSNIGDQLLRLIASLTKFDSEQAEQQFEGAFSQRVQSRLPNQGPPRELTTMKIDKAYEQVVSAVTTLMHAKRTVPLVKNRSTEFLSFMLQFSASPTPNCALVRAMTESLVLKVLPDQQVSAILGRTTAEWVTMDISETTRPRGVLESPNAEVQQLLKDFFAQAGLCYADLVITMCQNRARQRQNLAHAIVAWDGLQVAAEQLEERLGRLLPPNTAAVLRNAMPIASWVFLRKMQIMIWVVLLGFELNIYKPWEASRMQYYGKSLLKAENEHLIFIRDGLDGFRGKKTPEHQYAVNFVSSLIIESEAIGKICDASLSYSLALEAAGLLGVPANSYSSDELQYGLRMKPFYTVGVPAFVTYDEYKASKGQSSADLCKLAKASSAACRNIIDAFPSASRDLELLKRSAVGVAVNTAILERGKTGTVEWNRDGFHPFFPVLRVL